MKPRHLLYAVAVLIGIAGSAVYPMGWALPLPEVAAPVADEAVPMEADRG